MSEAASSQPDGSERAQRILDAAAKLITHYGYDKTTVGDIAREAGVSKGAIYLHWRSKDALFEALLKREITGYMKDYLARLRADPEGGTFYGMYKSSLLALRENPILRALFGRDRRVLGDYVQRLGNRAYERRFGARKELLKVMQDLGAMRSDADPEVVAYILTTMAFGLMKIDEVIPPEEAPPFEVVMDVLADMVHRALAPAGGGDTEASKAAILQMMENALARLDDAFARDDHLLK